MDEAVTNSVLHDSSDSFIPVSAVILATIITIVVLVLSTSYCIWNFSFTIWWAHHRGHIYYHRNSAILSDFNYEYNHAPLDSWSYSVDPRALRVCDEPISFVNPRDVWAPSSRERDLQFQSQQETDDNTAVNLSSNLEGLSAVVESETRVQNGVVQHISEPSGTCDHPKFHLGPSSSTENSNVHTADLENAGSSVAKLGQPAPNQVASQPPLTLICCDTTFPTQAHYNRHRRYHDKPQSCLHCPRDFGTTKDLNRHINDIHERTKVFYCLKQTCRRSRALRGKGFSRKENWKRHMKDAHGVDVN
ncbi:hypothetical protein BDZ45DRAFT_808928 [Acephala macrosclerotiorum]|nr:hypothetical protein BDZ45DRAFT_808928 [Acephala macrosclerotiorum]